jgi:hypothetical protein
LELGLVPVAVMAALFAASADLVEDFEGDALRGTAFFAPTGFRPLLGAWRVDCFVCSSSALFAIGLPRLPLVFSPALDSSDEPAPTLRSVAATHDHLCRWIPRRQNTRC